MLRALSNARKWVAAAASVAVVAGALTAAGASGPDGGAEGDPEPVLGQVGDPGATPPAAETRAARREPPRRRDARRPPSPTGDEEAPPRRILEENARLRRELDHLRTLAAERQRVAGVLQAAAIYDAPLQLGAGGLAWPVSGAVVSPFGQRWGRLHAGIDIASPAGTVIRAAQTGRVVLSGPTGGYGNYVCVRHTTRLDTCYAHLSGYLTELGATVRQGAPIGLVGCTGHCFGDHLHFETWLDGQPVDPMGYL